MSYAMTMCNGCGKYVPVRIYEYHILRCGEEYKDPLACEPANPYKRVEGYRVDRREG